MGRGLALARPAPVAHAAPLWVKTDQTQTPQRRVAFGSLETAYISESPATAADSAVVFVHGFGACKEHWRHNLPALARTLPCYALDLIGFGASSKPPSVLEGEAAGGEAVRYCVDFWAEQVPRLQKLGWAIVVQPGFARYAAGVRFSF